MVKHPSTVVYLTVFVPVQRTEASALVDNDDARRIVERYLYGGWSVVEQDLDADSMTHEVLVRHESMSSDLDMVADGQRERFASGMYHTSEPTILTVS